MTKNKSQVKTTIKSATSLAEEYNSDPMTQKVLAKALGLFYKGNSRDEVEMVLRQDFPGDFDFTDILNYVERELLSSFARRDSFNLKNTIKSGGMLDELREEEAIKENDQFFDIDAFADQAASWAKQHDVTPDRLEMWPTSFFEEWTDEIQEQCGVEFSHTVMAEAWRKGVDPTFQSVNRRSKPNLKNTIKSAKEMRLQLFDTGAFKLDLSQEKDNSLLCSTVKGSCDVGAVLSVASRDGYTFQDLSQGVDLSNSPLFTEYQDLLVSTAVLKPDTLQTVKRKIASGVVSGKELGKELQQWGLDNPGQVFQSMQVLGTDLAAGDSFKSVGVPIRSSGRLNQATLDYFAERGITKYAISNGHICYEDSSGYKPSLSVNVVFSDGDIGSGWGITKDMIPCIQGFLERYGNPFENFNGEMSAPLSQSAKGKLIKVNSRLVPLSWLLSSAKRSIKSVRRPITMSFCSRISPIITEAVYAASHGGLTDETLYGIINIVAQNEDVSPTKVFFDLADGLKARSGHTLCEDDLNPGEIPNETAQDFVRCVRRGTYWERLPNSALDNPSARDWREIEEKKMARRRGLAEEEEFNSTYLQEATSSKSGVKSGKSGKSGKFYGGGIMTSDLWGELERFHTMASNGYSGDDLLWELRGIGVDDETAQALLKCWGKQVSDYNLVRSSLGF